MGNHLSFVAQDKDFCSMALLRADGLHELDEVKIQELVNLQVAGNSDPKIWLCACCCLEWFSTAEYNDGWQMLSLDQTAKLFWHVLASVSTQCMRQAYRMPFQECQQLVISEPCLTDNENISCSLFIPDVLIGNSFVGNRAVNLCDYVADFSTLVNGTANLN